MRNYKKEYEKEKESKVTRLVKINKEDFELLLEKLEENNKSFNGFINEKIKEYIR